LSVNNPNNITAKKTLNPKRSKKSKTSKKSSFQIYKGKRKALSKYNNHSHFKFHFESLKRHLTFFMPELWNRIDKIQAMLKNTFIWFKLDKKKKKKQLYYFRNVTTLWCHLIVKLSPLLYHSTKKLIWQVRNIPLSHFSTDISWAVNLLYSWGRIKVLFIWSGTNSLKKMVNI